MNYVEYVYVLTAHEMNLSGMDIIGIYESRSFANGAMELEIITRRLLNNSKTDFLRWYKMEIRSDNLLQPNLRYGEGKPGVDYRVRHVEENSAKEFDIEFDEE